jgi:hypothetical protein
MRKNNESTIKEAIDRLIEAYKLEGGLDEISIVEEWKKQMGPAISNRTEEIYMDGDTLHIKLNSSTLRQELSYGKERIMHMINQTLGRQVIKQIVLK